MTTPERGQPSGVDAPTELGDERGNVGAATGGARVIRRWPAGLHETSRPE